MRSSTEAAPGIEVREDSNNEVRENPSLHELTQGTGVSAT